MFCGCKTLKRQYFLHNTVQTLGIGQPTDNLLQNEIRWNLKVFYIFQKLKWIEKRKGWDATKNRVMETIKLKAVVLPQVLFAANWNGI